MEREREKKIRTARKSKGKGKKCKKNKGGKKEKKAGAAAGVRATASTNNGSNLSHNPVHLAALSAVAFLILVVGAFIARNKRRVWDQDRNVDDDVDVDEMTPLNSASLYGDGDCNTDTLEYALPAELRVSKSVRAEIGVPSVDRFIDDEVDRYMNAI